MKTPTQEDAHIFKDEDGITEEKKVVSKENLR